MKKLIFLLVIVLFTCACAGDEVRYYEDQEEKLTNSPICPSRKNEHKRARKWLKKSPRDILEENKIPYINFEFDSTIIKQSSYEVLDKVAEVMNANHKIKLVIEGHTDTVGSNEYNDWLSGARTSAVKDYLVSRGVTSEYIKTFGHGSRKPITAVDSPIGRACNRRVILRFTTRSWNTVF